MPEEIGDTNLGFCDCPLPTCRHVLDAVHAPGGVLGVQLLVHEATVALTEVLQRLYATWRVRRVDRWGKVRARGVDAHLISSERLGLQYVATTGSYQIQPYNADKACNTPYQAIGGAVSALLT